MICAQNRWGNRPLTPREYAFLRFHMEQDEKLKLAKQRQRASFMSLLAKAIKSTDENQVNELFAAADKIYFDDMEPEKPISEEDEIEVFRNSFPQFSYEITEKQLGYEIPDDILQEFELD